MRQRAVEKQMMHSMSANAKAAGHGTLSSQIRARLASRADAENTTPAVSPRGGQPTSTGTSHVSIRSAPSPAQLASRGRVACSEQQLAFKGSPPSPALLPIGCTQFSYQGQGSRANAPGVTTAHGEFYGAPAGADNIEPLGRDGVRL